MAIYHCSIKIGGRSKGQSAIAASAYRSGSKLYDHEIGEYKDYTKRKGVVHSEVSLCENAPGHFTDREKLWQSVHEVERSSNAQLWREVEVALPIEFTRGEQIETVREYVKNFTDVGMCADWSLHDKKDGNPHAHIMLTTRPIKENGEWGIKEKKDYALDERGERIPIIDPKTGAQKVDGRNRKQWKREYVQVNDWNNPERAEQWREAWATSCNRRLDEKNKIDHRSYARQGIEKEPTIHEGYAARQMAKRGEVSDRAQHNANVAERNRLIVAIKQITQLIREIIDALRSNAREGKPAAAPEPRSAAPVTAQKPPETRQEPPRAVTPPQPSKTATKVNLLDYMTEKERQKYANDREVAARGEKLVSAYSYIGDKENKAIFEKWGRLHNIPFAPYKTNYYEENKAVIDTYRRELKVVGEYEAGFSDRTRSEMRGYAVTLLKQAKKDMAELRETAKDRATGKEKMPMSIDEKMTRAKAESIIREQQQKNRERSSGDTPPRRGSYGHDER